MSTEQKDLETNALAARLGRGWEQFRKGQLVSYRIMALVLLVAAGGFVWWYIAHERTKEKGRAWVGLEEADSAEKLEEFRDKHQGELVGRLAALHLARTLLGPDGIEKLPPKDVDFSELFRPGSAKTDFDALEKQAAARQPAAIASVEKARGLYLELADQFTDPVLKSECYEGAAKAEAALLGVPKEGGPAGEMRGSPVKLREYLEKTAEVAGDTPRGTRAKDLAEKLRSGDFQAQVRDVETVLLKREAPFGRTGGGGPMTVPGAVTPPHGPAAPTGPTPPPTVPGLPDPKAPTGPAPSANTPVITPGPAVTTPPPVGTTPIPPATAPLTPSGTPSTPAPAKK